jgi:hypothetical protein
MPDLPCFKPLLSFPALAFTLFIFTSVFPPPTFAQTPPSALYSFVVQAAAVKLKSNATPQDLINRIQAVLHDHPTTDILVTPEYTLYSNYLDSPVRVNCSVSACSVTPTDSPASLELYQTILTIQQLAQSTHTNIILGTVAEVALAVQYPDQLTSDVIFNSQLIINHQGQVIGVRRKTTEWYSSDSDCRFYHDQSSPACARAAYQMALATVKPYQVTLHCGRPYTIFTSICGERINQDLIDRAADFNVDLIVNSESEGDSQYEWITQSIQDSTFDPGRWGWNWLFNDIYLDQYIQAHHVVKPAGWYLTADSAIGQGGIINFQAEKLQFLNVTADYVYGEVGVRRIPGDFNADGLVETTDYRLLLNNWGKQTLTPASAAKTVSLDFAQQVVNWQQGQLTGIYDFDISGDLLAAHILSPASQRAAIDCLLHRRSDCVLSAQLVDDRPAVSPYDSRWQWHLDPSSVAFVSADQVQPECNVTPSQISQDPDYYLHQISHLCSSQALVKGYRLSNITLF